MLRVNHLSGFGKKPHVIGGFTGLIDVVGVSASVAFGLRKLRNAYSGSGVRVRRTSDDVEQDIGFSGEALDWAAAISFMGAGTLRVTTWYDQSGNGINAVQATTANQPTLDTTNTRVTFDGINDALKTGSNVTIGTNTLTIYMVRQFNSTAGTQVVAELGLLDQEGAAFTDVSGTFRFHISDDATVYNRKEDSVINTDLILDTAIADKSLSGSSETELYRNGAIPGTVSSPQTGNTSQDFAAAPVCLGHRDNAGAAFWYNGHMKEFVIFPAALGSTPRSDGETNINAYHSIY